MGTEFRLYGRLNCNYFDLVRGEKEPQQTKGLGLLLSKSPKALELLLRLIFPGQHIKKLLELRCIVDCEATQKGESQTKSSKRADIVIRFYDGFTPHSAIVVEAKGWDKKAKEEQVTNQIINYCEKFEILKEFKDKITAVTLTANRILSHQEEYKNVRGIVNITWLQLLDAFTEVNLPENKFEEELIKNYCDYLLNIKSDMKFYETEVLSIPAANSIERIEKFGIYECPNDKRYVAHRRKSLFMSFRKRGSISDCLYKVSYIVNMRFGDEDAINALKKINPEYAERVRGYCEASLNIDLQEEKWVIFLDLDKPIKLPHPCQLECYTQKPIKCDLSEFFQKPKAGDEYIILAKRTNNDQLIEE